MRNEEVETWIKNAKLYPDTGEVLKYIIQLEEDLAFCAAEDLQRKVFGEYES